MKHFNSMSVSSYFWTNCVWTSLLVALCRKLLYGYFGTRDLPDGKLLLAVLVAAVAVGMLLTMKQYRNDANVMINLFLGASVGLTAAAWVFQRSVALAAVAAAAVTVAGYLALVLVRYRGKRGVGRRASLGRCLRVGLINGRTLTALVLTVTMLGGLFLNASDASAEEEWDEMTISGEFDTVCQLEDDIWQTLSEKERLAVLQTIADIEADYLGIDRVRVSIEKLEERTLGNYSDSERCVRISRDYLEEMDGFEALEVLCHECYHAYQFRLVDLYKAVSAEHQGLFVFRKADRYRWEFTDYINGSEDYEAYAAQWCEIDSNDYAEDAVRRYRHELWLLRQE